MSEQTKTTQETTQNIPQAQEQPKGLFPNPNYVFTMSQGEFQALSQLLQAFAMPLAIVNSLRDRAIAEGGLIPVFSADMQDNGQVKQEFIDKHFPKKDNSIIINPNQN